MADSKAIFLYLDYLELFREFTLEERGRLITAMLEYVTTGAIPEFTGPERYVWPSLRNQIDRDTAKYEEKCRKNAENARKRRSENLAMESECKPF